MYLWLIVLSFLLKSPTAIDPLESIASLLFHDKQEDTLYTASLPLVEIKGNLPVRGDVVLLAKLINAEAPTEVYDGQWAVASVVRNRMDFANKPLVDIVFQSGQFDGIRSSRFKTWTTEQYRIAFRVLVKNERNLPKSVLFFHNKKTSTDRGWVATLSKFEYKTIGGHTFCHSKYLL